MKKIFLFGTALVAFTFVSCKKDRVCTCSGISSSSGGSSSSYSSSITYKKVTKREGRLYCGGGGSKGTNTSGGSTYSFDDTCTLK
ncbi:MAG: hypothetical protein ACXVC6_15095 [Bacteroidia bacterium]